MRRTLIVLALLCIGLGSAIAGFAIVNHVNPLVAITRVFVPTPQQVFGKNNLLVLVEGLDYDYTQNDQPFSSNSRSDVIWAVNFDFTNHHIYELSVLRDMLATFPNGTQHKINQAQSDGGPREAEQVIARFLGIPGFDRYAVLRINGAKQVIDAIGGVDVDVENSECLSHPRGCKNGPIDYDDTWGHLHVHLEPGWHHLNGAQAVGYMRFRHDWCSDPCRIMRQQQVTHALIAKLKGDKIGTLLHFGQLIKIMRENLQTNLTQNEMLSLATYYANITPKDLVTKETPYTGDVEMADGDDLIPDKVAIAQMARTMLIAPPTPIPPANPMALAAIPPGTLRVDVENGSGVKGAAHRIAGELREAGFQIGDIGDYSSDTVRSTEIEEHSSVLFAGARVREALPAQWRTVSIVPASGASGGSDVTIILGRDLARPE